MSNVRIKATIYTNDFYKEILDSHDLLSILMGMHDSFLKHDVIDNPEVREEIVFLINELKKRRKS